MKQIQGDQARKKTEQDRLLRDIESRQKQSQVTRPMAQFIDFISNVNPYKQGADLTKDQTKDIDEQRINAARAGYTMPDNKDMLALLKMQSAEKIAQTRSATSKGIEQDFKRYDRIERDIKELETDMDKKSLAYSSLDNALASGNLSEFTNQLATIAKGLGSEVSRLTEQDVDRAVARTARVDFAKLRAYFAGDPNVKIGDEYITSLKRAIDRGRVNTYEFITKMIDGKKRTQAAQPYMKGYMGEDRLGGVYTQTKDRYRNVLGVTDEIEGKYNAVRQIKEIKKSFPNLSGDERNQAIDNIINLRMTHRITPEDD